ncbi:MAG: dihydrofolate reductase [Collinsella sp.]
MRVSRSFIRSTRALAAVADEDVAWVIGGGAVYGQFLPYCSEAEITHNHVTHVVDTHSPISRRIPPGMSRGRSDVQTVQSGQG